MILLSVLAWAVPALLLAIVAFAAVAYRMMIRHPRFPTEWIVEKSLESGDVRREILDLPWERERIAVRGGYGIAAYFLPGTRPLLAVFHHGVGWDWHGMQRYMEVFIAAGWCVAALDSRGHGKSGGSGPSYGVFEKRDLREAIDAFARRLVALGGEAGGASWPSDPAEVLLLLFGESMGAATVLQCAPTEPRVRAVVADSAFASAYRELDHRLARTWVPAVLRVPIKLLVDLACRVFDGFSLRDADPARAIMETRIPILLIAGRDDDYVPWKFSVEMYEARKEYAPTRLELFDGAIHARAWHSDRARYDALVLSFAEEAMKGAEAR